MRRLSGRLFAGLLNSSTRWFAILVLVYGGSTDGSERSSERRRCTPRYNFAVFFHIHLLHIRRVLCLRHFHVLSLMLFFLRDGP